MAKRIKMYINASGFDDGITYGIHRDGSAEPVIRVNEKQCAKRMFSQTGEVLVQSEDSPVDFKVSRSYLAIPMPRVYMDGYELPVDEVVLHPNERTIRIQNHNVEPNTTRVITMDYSYLTSVVEDDYTLTQTGVSHLSIVPVTGLRPPEDITYELDMITRNLKVSIVPDFTPVAYRYKMVTEHKSGKKSAMSAEREIELFPHEADVRYVLETSNDRGVTWRVIREQLNPLFELSATADITSERHVPLPINIASAVGKVTIQIQNPWYRWHLNLRATNRYRVKAKEVGGYETSYLSSLGSGINFKPLKLKVRRKEHNGKPAEYSGLDALDMWEVFEADIDPGEPYLTFQDDHLVSGKTYSYTFFIDDERGFRSLPFMETTLIP